MDETLPDFMEAPIYMVSVGPMAGMYVASYAHDRCGYMGKFLQYTITIYAVVANSLQTSVILDYLYNKIGVPIKVYPHRGRSLNGGLLRQLEHLSIIVELGEQIPPRVTHPSEDSILTRQAVSTSRALKRSYAMLGKFINCHDLRSFD